MHAQPYTDARKRALPLPLSPPASAVNPPDPDRGTRSWTSNRTRYAVLRRQTGVCATTLHSLDQVQSTGRCRCNRRITFVYRSSWDRKRIRLFKIFSRSFPISRYNVSNFENLLARDIPFFMFSLFYFFSFLFYGMLIFSLRGYTYTIYIWTFLNYCQYTRYNLNETLYSNFCF